MSNVSLAQYLAGFHNTNLVARAQDLINNFLQGDCSYVCVVNEKGEKLQLTGKCKLYAVEIITEET